MNARKLSFLALALFPHVGTPSAAVAQRPTELWRIGGAPDGPLAFDQVIDLKAGGGGTLVLLDRRQAQVRFYDTTGRHVRSVGRRGAGPGEFRSPTALAVAPNKTVLVHDLATARFTILRADGTVERTIPVVRQPRLAFNIVFDGSFDRTGRLYMSNGVPPKERNAAVPELFGDSALVTERWRPDLSRSDTLTMCGAPPAITRDPSYAPLRAGSNTLIRRESGRCSTVLARVHLVAAAQRIPDPVRTASMKLVPEEFRIRIPCDYPAFRSLRVDDANRLWVERDVTSGKRFDVFASDGKALGTALAPAALDTSRPFVIAGTSLYGFVLDGDQVPYLTAWRMQVR